MVAQSGTLFLLKLRNDAGTPAFVPVAGLRSRSLAFNAQVIDITNSDSVGQFREILAGYGIKSLSVSGAGVAVTKASFEVIRDAAFDQSLRDAEITVPDFGVFTFKVKVSAFELTGAHDGALEFSATLESSGDVTFVAAT